MPDQDAFARHDAALQRLGGRVDRAEASITALEMKMDGTILALEANTASNKSLGDAINRLSDYVLRLDSRLEAAVQSQSRHLLEAERDRGTVRRVSLYAWLWLAGAVVAATGWVLTILHPGLGTALRSALHTVSE